MNRLINLLRRISSLAYNSYAVIHAQFPGFVVYGGLLPISLSIIFACAGYDRANQICAVIWVLVGFYIGTLPVVVATSAAAGAVSDPKHPVAGVEDKVVKAYKGIRTYFFYLAAWSLIIGVTGIYRNWGSIITVLAIIIVTTMMKVAWGVTGKGRARKIFISGLSIVLVFNFMTVISPVFYNKTLGFDPVTYFRPSVVDEQIVKAEKTAKDIRDAYVGQMLAGISNTIDPGTGQPANIELLTVQKVRVEINAQKIQAIKEEQYPLTMSGFKKAVLYSFRNPRGVEGAEDNPQIRIVKHSDKAWEVEFLTDQMTTVLRRWPAGATIVFAGYEEKEVTRNNPAGGNEPFYLPVGVPLGRTADTSLIVKYKVGGKIILNFS
ncbi:MAG: hypothetical protein PHF50_00195 [Patescibacteria group bacterium]|nr:hypothetical protein [Patescibacteria group bacterium]